MKILIILLRHLGSLYPAFKLLCKCSCPILAILLTAVIKLYFHFRIMKTEVNLFLSTFSSTAQDPEQHSCRHHSPLAKWSKLRLRIFRLSRVAEKNPVILCQLLQSMQYHHAELYTHRYNLQGCLPGMHLALVLHAREPHLCTKHLHLKEHLSMLISSSFKIKVW